VNSSRVFIPMGIIVETAVDLERYGNIPPIEIDLYVHPGGMATWEYEFDRCCRPTGLVVMWQDAPYFKIRSIRVKEHLAFVSRPFKASLLELISETPHEAEQLAMRKHVEFEWPTFNQGERVCITVENTDLGMSRRFSGALRVVGVLP
jgi:hypothetical protein